MSKFTFICEDEPCPFGSSITTKRTFEFDAVELSGIVGEFETFLRGCGFTINGFLDVVNEDEQHEWKTPEWETPQEETNFDFSQFPNNNWPFAVKEDECGK